jgi:hypothetical protein
MAARIVARIVRPVFSRWVQFWDVSDRAPHFMRVEEFQLKVEESKAIEEEYNAKHSKRVLDYVTSKREEADARGITGTSPSSALATKAPASEEDSETLDGL